MIVAPERNKTPLPLLEAHSKCAMRRQHNSGRRDNGRAEDRSCGATGSGGDCHLACRSEEAALQLLPEGQSWVAFQSEDMPGMKPH